MHGVLKQSSKLAIMALLLTLGAASAQEGELEAGTIEYDPNKVTDAMKAETETIAQALDGPPPKGWTRPGMIERYTMVNLYDKINGRSELYNSYDVVGMTFVTYSNPADSTHFIDVFLYDMRTAIGAYGVFSVERSGGNPAIDLGRGGYRTGKDLFFWKGQYYATVLGSHETPEVQERVLAVATEVESRLEDSGGSVWGLDALPKENRIDETVQYFQIDALALGFMTDTFTAEYTVGEDSVTVFLSRQDDAKVAKEKREAFVEYLTKYGDGVERTTLDGTEIVSADMGGGFFDAVFQHENFLAGATAVRGRETALKMATDFLTALKAEGK